LESTVKDSVILDFWDVDDIEQLTGSGSEQGETAGRFTIKVVNSSFIYGTILLPFFFKQTGIVVTLGCFLGLFGLSYCSCNSLLKVKQLAK
jgi:hypothetical protein